MKAEAVAVACGAPTRVTPAVDQARVSHGGLLRGASWGRRARSFSHAGLYPVRSRRPLVRVTASSMTTGGAAITKSPRYDQTRAVFAAWSPPPTSA
eukprot:13339734-Alexandrium_andersonii.AAC.1